MSTPAQLLSILLALLVMPLSSDGQTAVETAPPAGTSPLKPSRGKVIAQSQPVVAVEKISFEHGSVQLVDLAVTVRHEFVPAAPNAGQGQPGGAPEARFVPGLSLSMVWDGQIKPESDGRAVIVAVRIDSIEDASGQSIIIKDALEVDPPGDGPAFVGVEGFNGGSDPKFFIRGRIEHDEEQSRFDAAHLRSSYTTRTSVRRVPNVLGKIRGQLDVRTVEKYETFKCKASELSGQRREIVKGVWLTLRQGPARWVPDGMNGVVLTFARDKRDPEAMITPPIPVGFSLQTESFSINSGGPERRLLYPIGGGLVEYIECYDNRDTTEDPAIVIQVLTKTSQKLVPFEITAVPTGTGQ
jgi:hypothetical protein